MPEEKEKNNGGAASGASLNEEQVKSIVESTIDAKLKYARAIVVAFGTGLFLLVVAGLIGGGDLVQTIHNHAFPPQLPDQVSVAYESSLKLQASDPDRQSQSISFWSTGTQQVEMLVQAVQTDQSPGLDQRNILITIDGKPISGEPTPPDEIREAFQPITSFLRQDADLTETPDVHTIVFSLDDAQSPEDPLGEVVITTVVLVKGAE